MVQKGRIRILRILFPKSLKGFEELVLWYYSPYDPYHPVRTQAKASKKQITLAGLSTVIQWKHFSISIMYNDSLIVGVPVFKTPE